MVLDLNIVILKILIFREKIPVCFIVWPYTQSCPFPSSQRRQFVSSMKHKEIFARFPDWIKVMNQQHCYWPHRFLWLIYENGWLLWLQKSLQGILPVLPINSSLPSYNKRFMYLMGKCSPKIPASCSFLVSSFFLSTSTLTQWSVIVGKGWQQYWIDVGIYCFWLLLEVFW